MTSQSRINNNEWIETLKEDLKKSCQRISGQLVQCLRAIFYKPQEDIPAKKGYEQTGHDTADYFKDDENEDDDDKYDNFNVLKILNKQKG